MMKRRRTTGRSRRSAAGERGATGPHLQAERRRPPHQRQPRRRRRPARDRRERPRPDRGRGTAASRTIDENGKVSDFVTSGITAEEHRRIAAWSDGPRLFEHLRDLPGPLTLGKTRDYVRSLGFPADLLPPGTLQATPMRHRGAHIGNFFLADKAAGEEFTDDDEETLVLFASQAAAAIANARTYRRERRARADLGGAGRDVSRWASWSSTPAPAARCRSTARRSASSAGCARGADPPTSCSDC